MLPVAPRKSPTFEIQQPEGLKPRIQPQNPLRLKPVTLCRKRQNLPRLWHESTLADGRG